MDSTTVCFLCVLEVATSSKCREVNKNFGVSDHGTLDSKCGNFKEKCEQSQRIEQDS